MDRWRSCYLDLVLWYSSLFSRIRHGERFSYSRHDSTRLASLAASCNLTSACNDYICGPSAWMSSPMVCTPGPPDSSGRRADTMSSTRSKSVADSIAVLSVWILTLADSSNPYVRMSTTLPVSPSMPYMCSPAACLARSSVSARIAFPPQFWISVRGMTSRASAMALYGAPATPGIDLAFSDSATLIAISVAPPPGASRGLNTTLRATDMASARLRSISFRMSFDGPRSRIVHALGDLQSSRKVKYSSPSFSMWNRPHPVPTSESRRSSTRLTIVAPTARAIRLLSDFLTRRIAVMGGSALRR